MHSYFSKRTLNVFFVKTHESKKLTQASGRRDVLFWSGEPKGFGQRTHAPRVTGFEHQLVCQFVVEATNSHRRFFGVILFRAIVAHASPEYPVNVKSMTNIRDGDYRTAHNRSDAVGSNLYTSTVCGFLAGGSHFTVIVWASVFSTRTLIGGPGNLSAKFDNGNRSRRVNKRTTNHQCT